MSANATRTHGGPITCSPVVVPNDYLAMIRRLPLLPIESTDVYRRAMTVANDLLKKKAKDGKLLRGEAGYLSVLLDLLEDYEKSKFPRQRVSDGEMLAHLIEAKNVTQSQVERDIGIAAPTISAVIAGRRKLTRGQIGKLSAYFGVTPTVFSFDV